MWIALVLAVAAPQTPPALPLTPLPPADVHIDGWLGQRIDANRTAWLDTVDLDARLEPFEHRPARQAWAGEHLGKWLWAASKCQAATGDPLLRARIDDAARRLIATQEDDGYLGAYLAPQRFQLLPGADWDVWTIKYALLGLLEYHRATGDPAALDACQRAVDLLISTFGAGQRPITSAGTHVGMAATSILEAVVGVGAATGATLDLAFAQRIVDALDAPGGPRLLTGLRTHGRVARTANGKAYELLSNLVGLCALYRATGDRTLLDVVERAWEDIVVRELLPTGSASSFEHFVGGGRLPSTQRTNPAETCVTVTWLQLNVHLLEITGDARYGREIERTAFNHLPAAQRPDGGAWCYYTGLSGTKPYASTITCCSSSGPRGMALLPEAAVLVDAGGALCVNLPTALHGTATLGGRRVSFAQDSALPRDGTSTLRFGGELPATFAVRIRLSDWAVPATLTIGDDQRAVTEPGFVEIPARTWRDTDTLVIRVSCAGRIATDPADPTRAYLAHGPFVLAFDERLTPAIHDAPIAATPVLPTGSGRSELPFAATVRIGGAMRTVPMRTFADVGADGAAHRVWIGTQQRGTLFAARSARSRAGNVDGSIADGDPDTFAVTFDGTRAEQDWYSLELARPTTVRSIRFAHGHVFHDGGWFDTSASKPLVQVRRARDGAWETVGTLDAYPATTATDHGGLRDGASFELAFAALLEDVLAVRVAGVPACGDDPRQAFSSCGELTARR
ncbi:MAG: glycoside hydrolase family 127 protein [Planctomycetes bacterium]|nr:glycoside hydrolase family 127 protein [Planctomycetota bacterium]